MKILKGPEHILQSLAPKDHRLYCLITQLMLPKALAGQDLSILVAKANSSMINHYNIYKKKQM